jgi:hypothetical protein
MDNHYTWRSRNRLAGEELPSNLQPSANLLSTIEHEHICCSDEQASGPLEIKIQNNASRRLTDSLYSIEKATELTFRGGN